MRHSIEQDDIRKHDPRFVGPDLSIVRHTQQQFTPLYRRHTRIRHTGRKYHVILKHVVRQDFPQRTLIRRLQHGSDVLESKIVRDEESQICHILASLLSTLISKIEAKIYSREGSTGTAKSSAREVCEQWRAEAEDVVDFVDDDAISNTDVLHQSQRELSGNDQVDVRLQ